jgi:hypothetical protein
VNVACRQDAFRFKSTHALALASRKPKCFRTVNNYVPRGVTFQPTYGNRLIALRGCNDLGQCPFTGYVTTLGPHHELIEWKFKWIAFYVHDLYPYDRLKEQISQESEQSRKSSAKIYKNDPTQAP